MNLTAVQSYYSLVSKTDYQKRWRTLPLATTGGLKTVRTVSSTRSSSSPPASVLP